jgi:hypothetical protein
MSVLLFKILSIAVKTLARPLINWLSYYNRLRVQESNHRIMVFLRLRLVWIGQKFNYYNVLINRKIFGLVKEEEIKPLTDEKALERGAELLSEMIVYSIILGIPIYEMIKSQKSSAAKEKKKKDFLINIQTDCDNLVENSMENRRSLEDIKTRLGKIKNILSINKI